MVVEASPVIPGEKDRRAIPVGPLHDGVDKTGNVCLAIANQSRRMFAVLTIGHHPGYSRKSTVLGGLVEVRNILDVAELSILKAKFAAKILRKTRPRRLHG